MTTEEPTSKVEAQFEATLNSLIAIIGGKKKLFPSNKVGGDTLSVVVEELFAEEREANEKDIKDKLKSILTNYAAMQKEFTAKEKELAQLREKKLKEFNEAAKLLFSRIENLKDLEKSYYGALSATAPASTGTSEAPVVVPPSE